MAQKKRTVVNAKEEKKRIRDLQKLPKTGIYYIDKKNGALLDRNGRVRVTMKTAKIMRIFFLAMAVFFVYMVYRDLGTTNMWLDLAIIVFSLIFSWRYHSYCKALL